MVTKEMIYNELQELQKLFSIQTVKPIKIDYNNVLEYHSDIIARRNIAIYGIIFALCLSAAGLIITTGGTLW